MVPVCERGADEVGYCHGHYEYRRRTGVEPTHKLHSDYTVVERFLLKTSEGNNGCVLWTGATDGDGRYGSFYYEGRVRRAHRVAYVMFVGPIPEGLDLDHLCRVTQCVNPAHMEPVSHGENVLRGESIQAKNARKTHCKRGHQFTAVDLRPRGRVCQRCAEIRNYYRRTISPHITWAEIDALESERMAAAS